MATQQEVENWIKGSAQALQQRAKESPRAITPEEVKNVLIQQAEQQGIMPDSNQFAVASARLNAATKQANKHGQEAAKADQRMTDAHSALQAQAKVIESTREKLQRQTRSGVGWQRSQEVSELKRELNHSKAQAYNLKDKVNGQNNLVSKHSEMRSNSIATIATAGFGDGPSGRLSKDKLNEMVAAQETLNYKGKDYGGNLKQLAGMLADKAAGGSAVPAEKAAFERALIEKFERGPAKAKIDELKPKVDALKDQLSELQEQANDPRIGPLTKMGIEETMSELQEQLAAMNEELEEAELDVRNADARLGVLQASATDIPVAFKAEQENRAMAAELEQGDDGGSNIVIADGKKKVGFADESQEQPDNDSSIIIEEKKEEEVAVEGQNANWRAARPRTLSDGQPSAKESAGEDEGKLSKSTREAVGGWKAAKPSVEAGSRRNKL